LPSKMTKQWIKYYLFYLNVKLQTVKLRFYDHSLALKENKTVYAEDKMLE